MPDETTTENPNWVKKNWDEYRKVMVPPDAGVDRVVHTRLAFYSGACVAAQLILGAAKELDGLTMEGVGQELNAFIDEVGQQVLAEVIRG